MPHHHHLHPVLFGTGGIHIAAPSPPALSIISNSAGVVTFAMDVDNTVGAGDTVELQIQITGGNWSSPVSDTVHTITAPEDAANEVDLSISLTNVTYDARADVKHNGATSPWSNVVTFTVSGAAAVTPTFYILGF